MQIDLQLLLRSARRWWWILVVVPLAVCGLALVYTQTQPRQYEATSRLMVNPSGTGQLDYNTILSAERLTKTYQKLVTDRAVFEAVIAHNSLSLGVGDLKEMVKASADGETQLLTITVHDTDPARAALIANAVAAEFVTYIRSQSTTSGGQSLEQLEQAFADVDKEINATEARLAKLEGSSKADEPETKTEIASLQANLDALRPTYASLLTSIADAKAKSAAAVDRVTLSSAAYPPSVPFAPRPLVNAILAFMLGLGLAGAVIALLEYRDNTVKGNAEFGESLGIPLLSNVLAVPNIIDGRKQLFVLDQPKSASAESIRLLRTNIEFASATSEITTLGITSANPSEGKSTIAANLAVTLAQAGFATALIDADLRRPSQHRIHGIANDRGLSTLLTHADQAWNTVAHVSAVPNLTVISSGPLPPNPADLLSLDRLRNLLTEMRETFDVIVVDTPPVLAVSDPLIVAAHVDGMLVVTFAGKTRIDAIKRSVETLRRGSVRIVGVVVNRQSTKQAGDYYYQDYHAVADRPEAGGSRRRGSRTSTALEPGSASSAD